MLRNPLSPARVAVFVLVGGVMAAACTSGGPATNTGSFELKEGDPYTFRGTGDARALTPSELATYREDKRYLRSLVRPGIAVSLNHADARQHRFAMLRLRLAGKTPQNSPELFRMLATLRARHQAKGYQEGTFAAAETASEYEWSNQHYILSAQVVGSQLEAISTASRKDPLNYGYVDVGVWTADGQPVGNLPYTEVYGDMPYTNVVASAELTEEQQLQEFESDSLLLEDTVQDGYQQTYVVDDVAFTETEGGTASSESLPVSSAGDVTANNGNRPTYGLSIVAPIDRPTDNDTYISVCLNRTWTQDCDYDLTASTQALKIPLRGSITLSTGYIFDKAKLDAYKAGADQGGQIRVTLTNVGGGCNVDRDNSMYTGMRTFWSSTTLSSDLRTLSWDLTGAKAALFDDSCRQVQDRVILTLNLRLPWRYSNGATGVVAAFISNSTGPSSGQIAPIKVTNSCLAKGTRIELADGSSTPIEGIEAGDRVSNPYAADASGVTVTDTARGFELTPMVRIVDEGGRSLLMTEMHPILIVERGMVLAKHLNVGDQVMTRQGPSRLVRVTREKYDGDVYNLKVGTAAEAKGLGEDQTVVYANGILVGDGQIQSKYETLEMSKRRVATRIPARWRVDYLSSARQAARL